MRRRLVLGILSLVLLAVLVGATPVAAAGDWPTYVVKSGDNLSRIAASHHVTLSALIAANGSRWPYIIYPGQILVIPDVNAPIWIDSPQNWQTVSSPITVTGRSTSFEGALSVRVRDRWGAVLTTTHTTGGSMGVFAPFTATLTFSVPSNQWGSVEAYSNSAATGAEEYNTGVRVTLSKTSGPAPVYRTHVVVRGETLLRIALRYAVSWRAIASLNGLSNPNLIYVGQRLLIP
jgi:peptidoglycan-N-acetylglucosamine deacetylase